MQANTVSLRYPFLYDLTLTRINFLLKQIFCFLDGFLLGVSLEFSDYRFSRLELAGVVFYNSVQQTMVNGWSTTLAHLL